MMMSLMLSDNKPGLYRKRRSRGCHIIQPTVTCFRYIKCAAQLIHCLRVKLYNFATFRFHCRYWTDSAPTALTLYNVKCKCSASTLNQWWRHLETLKYAQNNLSNPMTTPFRAITTYNKIAAKIYYDLVMCYMWTAAHSKPFLWSSLFTWPAVGISMQRKYILALIHVCDAWVNALLNISSGLLKHTA